MHSRALAPINLAHTHIIEEPESLFQVPDAPTASNQHRVVALQRLQALFLQHLSLKQIQGLCKLGKETTGEGAQDRF